MVPMTDARRPEARRRHVHTSTQIPNHRWRHGPRRGAPARRLRLDPVRLRASPHQLQPDRDQDQPGERRDARAGLVRPRREASSARRLRWPTGSPTSAPTTRSCTRSTRPARPAAQELRRPARRSGPPPQVARSTRRRRSRTGSSTSAPPTASCTRSTRPARPAARGLPKTCAPLWTASLGTEVESSPAVANGVVYISSDDDKLYALDAAGVTGCSGSPGQKTCAPLWTAVTRGSVSSSPAVANGIVYAGSIWGELFVFDAAGVNGCSGIPKTCVPLWTDLGIQGGVGFYSAFMVPVVANGVVYVGSFNPTRLGAVRVRRGRRERLLGHPEDLRATVDGRTRRQCLRRGGGRERRGLPRRVTQGLPLRVRRGRVRPAPGQRSAPRCGPRPFRSSAAWRGLRRWPTASSMSSPSTGSSPRSMRLGAASRRGCVCNPLWTVFVGDHSESSPAVANGVVYVGSYDKSLSRVPPALSCPPRPWNLLFVVERREPRGIGVSPMRRRVELGSNHNTMSEPRETRTVERRPTRSLFIALGVVGLLAVVLGRCSEATSQLPQTAVGRTRPPVELDMATVPPQLATVTTSPPTTPTSTRPAVPARPSPGCANPTGSQAPGTSDVPIVSRGERRSYLRTIPIRNESAPAPLVVVLDDGSGDPGAFVDRARWGAIAQLQHLIVAAPRWTRADDDQFAADAIVDIGLGTCVDLARVYLAGFSTGAMLGTRVVCEHPGLVTAFVAVAGLLAPDRCSPDDRVPVLAVQGALDEAVSPSSVVDAAKAWARQDRCQPEPVSEMVGWEHRVLRVRAMRGRRRRAALRAQRHGPRMARACRRPERRQTVGRPHEHDHHRNGVL